jgi:hypothetical protein
MNLPAHYTVAEVIEALEVRLADQELQRYTFKDQYEKSKEPKYEKTWFGYYRKVEYWYGYHEYEGGGYEYKHYKEAALETSAQLSALRKLPLDAKVKLTVEEINDLFNKETDDGK